MTETVEQRTRRRRWLSLAEIVGVGGLLTAGAGLYLSWSDHRDAAQVREDDRRAAQEAQRAERRRIGLVASDAGGDTLAFKGVSCAIQAATITFPPSLHLAQQSTVTVHAIEASWFAGPLLTLTDGGADTRQGKLPVLIDSDCQDENGTRSERAIYDLIWRTHPRPLRGRAVEVRGMLLHQEGGTAAQLDAIWSREKPRPSR